MIAESHFGLEGISFAQMFNGASGVVNGSNVGWGKRFGGARARLAFVESGGFPAMGSQKLLDIR